MKNLIVEYQLAVANTDHDKLHELDAKIAVYFAKVMLNQELSELIEARGFCCDMRVCRDLGLFSDVLTLMIECGRPLEQLRLSLRSTTTGQLMRTISNCPGMEINDSIKEDVKILEHALLVHTLRRNEVTELYLTTIGKEHLTATQL